MESPSEEGPYKLGPKLQERYVHRSGGSAFSAEETVGTKSQR